MLFLRYCNIWFKFSLTWDKEISSELISIITIWLFEFGLNFIRNSNFKIGLELTFTSVFSFVSISVPLKCDRLVPSFDSLSDSSDAFKSIFKFISFRLLILCLDHVFWKTLKCAWKLFSSLFITLNLQEKKILSKLVSSYY